MLRAREVCCKSSVSFASPSVVLHIQQALMTWPQGLAGDVWVKNFSDPHWRLSMQNSKSQNLKVDSKGNGELTLSRSLTAAIWTTCTCSREVLLRREQWIAKTQTWWNKGMNKWISNSECDTVEFSLAIFLNWWKPEWARDLMWASKRKAESSYTKISHR